MHKFSEKICIYTNFFKKFDKNVLDLYEVFKNLIKLKKKCMTY